MADDPTLADDPADNPAVDPVEALLAEFLAHPEADRVTVLERLCSENPEQADELRASLEALKGIGIDALAAPDAVRFPERLGDFKLEQRLGGGGMGVVYLATQESLGRQVALKIIRPEHLFFEGARVRFQREIEAVARLQHPGIVQVFTVGEEEGVPYFAMERVVGCSLSDLLEHFQDRNARELTGAQLLDQVRHTLGLPPADTEPSGQEQLLRTSNWIQACVQLTQQVAEALEHAHERGVIHRDVKPSNILITPTGRALLLDFGVSYIPENAGKLTRSGTLVGSLPYLSPEQVRREGDLDRRVDVYSLGVTLYELLTLRLPYAADSMDALQRAILQGTPVPPGQSNREVPWDVETVCLAAMEPERNRRYASAEAFARDLRNVILLRPIEARRASTQLRMRRWIQRHQTLSVTLMLGFLALVVIPAFAAFRIIGERNRARLEAKTAEIILSFFVNLLEQSDPEASGGRDVSVREFLEKTITDLERFEGETYIKARIEEYLGRVLTSLGDPQRALPFLRSAVAAHRLGAGEQNDHHLSALAHLGSALLFSGEHREALETFKRVLSLREQVRDPRALAAALLDVGAALHKLGRDEEAELRIRGALEIYAAGNEASTRDRAVATQSLGVMLLERGQIEQARPLLQEALISFRQAGLEVSASTAVTLTNLALLEKQAGHLDGAATHLEEARELYRKLGLERHPDMLLLLNNWAHLQLARDDSEGA